MRTRFALAAAALLLASSAPTPAYDREPITIGDTVLGEISTPYSFQEFSFPAASGTYVVVTLSKAGGGTIRPIFAFFDRIYTSAPGGASSIPIQGLSANSAYNALPFGESTYRIVVGDGRGGVGQYKLKTRLSPRTLWAYQGTNATPTPNVAFGAHPGYDATLTVKWKGEGAVAVNGIVGPGDVPLTSSQAPRTTSKSFTQGGFRVPTVGDYAVRLDVPAGVVKWTAVVTLRGRPRPGATIDARKAPGLSRPGVEFPSSGLYPIVAVAGEVGGPNECLPASSGDGPAATFLHDGSGAGGCSRSPTNDGGYLLYCNAGYSARIRNVVRYPDGPWKDLVRSYDAYEIRSPQGSGSSVLTDIAYDAARRPTGWTELRRFDATGAEHRLVVSRAEYGMYDPGLGGYVESACSGFRVVHTPPGGVARTYDYGPFR